VHNEQIVGIAVRLFAIFLLIYTVRYLSDYIHVLMGESYFKGNITPLIILTILPFIVVILLWFFPLKVAAKLIPKINSAEQPVNLGNNEIEHIALSILGIWVLASAIPDVFYWSIFIYMIKSSGMVVGALRPENVGNIVAIIIEIIIGIWLLVGSKGIIGIIRRLRYAGG
jgi:hypothetical protein